MDPTVKGSVKRAISAPPTKRNAYGASKGPSISSSAGAANEDMFISAFEDVPRIQIFTNKDVENELIKIKDSLSDASINWEKRIDSLKLLRSLLVAGASEYDKFYAYLKLLEPPFQSCVKDLRSQVVREACITISFISLKIGTKCDRFMEVLLQHLISLIQNSAKIMSTSGLVCIRFIIQHTHDNKLIPIIVFNMSSKSKEIRRACCEFMQDILFTWPTHVIEKHLGLVQEAIKKGISDADPEARAYSRKAFWAFTKHFKEHADHLLITLDSAKQRLLYDEQMMIKNSSNDPLKSDIESFNPVAFRQFANSHSIKKIGSSVSTSNSVENLSRPLSSMGSMRNRSGIPTKTDSGFSSRTLPSPFRSTSAIDVGAARRARARAAINAISSQSKYPNTESLPRPIKKVDSYPTSIPSTTSIASPERLGRSKFRVSQSTPNSRSTSPSVRLGYHVVDGRAASRGRQKSGIPLSTSRETSPSRLSNYTAMERRLSGGSVRVKHFIGVNDKPITNSGTLLAEKMLQQSKEAEMAMESALKTETVIPRRRYNFDDHSDESETSSVCSDRSFGSYGGRNVEDVLEVIRNLSSAHWSDRKEGLLGLQYILRHSSQTLNAYELKRITDMFTKMLLDPHTKTFTLFLEILNELINVYKQDLKGWLYILMTRLFLKMGSDTLASVQTKILNTFELIRESFTLQDQFNVVIRFLSDQTQAPNVKVKICVLQYLHNLIILMNSNDCSSSLNNSELQLALMKIISWTADPKSQELRKHSLDIILDLFNLNTSEFSSILNRLPKTYQDAAFQTIKMKRRSNSESYSSSPHMPANNNNIIVSNNNQLQSPSLIRSIRQRNSLTSKVNDQNDYDNTENLNPEDIYTSLKQTTDEIQKYTFDVNTDLFVTKLTSSPTKITSLSIPPASSTSSSEATTPVNRNQNNSNSSESSVKKLTTNSPKRSSSFMRDIKEYTSNSQDSGISQIDGVINNNCLNNKSSPSPPNKISPTKNGQYSIGGEGDTSYTMVESNQDLFKIVFDKLNQIPSNVENQAEALEELSQLIRNANSQEWSMHFREAYRILLEKISKHESCLIRSNALKIMSEFLLKRSEFFDEYIELTILRLLDACKDNEKEVQRAAEMCSGVAAISLPPDQVVRVLKPVIMKTDETSITQAAIKMLNKLIEKQTSQTVLKLLPEMITPLIQAYDNSESAVRKAAVLCMVAIHISVGDELKPYLKCLNVSKMKLLKLYIDRSKSNSSNCTSPLSSK